MFRVAEALYAIGFEPARAETWHQDVRFFRIVDPGGACVGEFYVDLYARESKRGGAWMDEAVARCRKGGKRRGKKDDYESDEVQYGLCERIFLTKK